MKKIVTICLLFLFCSVALGARLGNVHIGDDTNYVERTIDGEIVLHGTARVSSCHIFESRELAPGSSGATETQLGNYVGYAYTINDDTVISFPMNKLHGWDSTSDLTVSIRYYINEAYATANGELQFEASWGATADGEAVDSPGSSDTIDSGDWNIPATAKHLSQAVLGTIPAASIEATDEIGIDIKRVALDDGNNPTAEPVIVCVAIGYTRNGI